MLDQSGPARGVSFDCCVAGRGSNVRQLVQSATPTDSKKRKLNLPGLRAAAPSRKAVKRLAVALPAIAVIGAVVASQIHPGKDDPARSAAFQVQSNHVAKSTRAGKPQPKGAHATRVAPKWTRSVSPHNVEVTHARKVHVRRPRPICAGRSGMLPANFGKIVAFLTAHGYTKMAAAGIAGNIYQESKGNPESVGTGGGGLIGWTPLPAGFVTGNVAADLHTQLEALLRYNQQWATYIPALNAATTPAQAAYIYMADFERPGLPAAYNRQGAAEAVAHACGMMG